MLAHPPEDGSLSARSTLFAGNTQEVIPKMAWKQPVGGGPYFSTGRGQAMDPFLELLAYKFINVDYIVDGVFLRVYSIEFIPISRMKVNFKQKPKNRHSECQANFLKHIFSPQKNMITCKRAVGH